MSIFDLFKPAVQQPAATQTPAAPAQQQAVPTAGTDVNGVVQPGSANPQNPANPAALKTSESASPLDTFSDLFKDTPKPNGTVEPSLDDPYINYDPKTIAESVAKFNFVNQDMQALGAKALAGDATALVDMMQGVAREVFMKAAQLSATVADRATAEGVTRMRSHIPNAIKSNSVSNSLEQLNPMLRHEAAKPMVDAITAQFQAKNPNATPQQIADLTVQYLNAVTGHKPQPANTQNTRVDPFAAPAGSQDFSDFFGPASVFQSH